jgi:glycosyltransferase involved in cell wall biosynthesis
MNGADDWTISFYQFLPAYLTNIKSSKHIIWLHGSVEHFFGGITKLLKGSYGKKLDKYDYVVTIADEMKEQLENYYPLLANEKIKRIYNPFDFEEIRNKADDLSNISEKERELLSNSYICTVTRLDEHQKDTTILIKAYKNLYDQNKITHKLYIIGDGPHKGQLEELVKSYSLEKNILFLGKKTNPYIWMKNADVFVLSSNFEGLPTVLMESMTVETFVISSNCKTGPKEILLNGDCGDLFEIGNVNELANKLEYALNDKAYMEDKIKLATKSLARFEKIKILTELDSILKET